MATRPIAANPQDRFVITLGNQIVVTTRNGGVFGHDVVGHRSGEAFAYSGAAAASNAVDRFVLTMGSTLIVITEGGHVFGHDVSGRNVGVPFGFSGVPAASNAVDRFVVALGNVLTVITQSGDVFGHDVNGRDVGAPFKFGGSRVAFNNDPFVVTMGNRIVVINHAGDVFGHEVNGREVGLPFKFEGSRAAFNSQDRRVLSMGNLLIVLTASGEAFAHEVQGRVVSPPFQLNQVEDKVTFDRSGLTTNLALGGSVQLVINRNGTFAFATHVHDSGATNLDYSASAVLLTTAGTAFTFQHTGPVEGTLGGLFGSPDRNDDKTTTGHDPRIAEEFDSILNGASFHAEIDGKDKLLTALQDLIAEAALELGKAAIKAVIQLVVA